jgi:uncharacterized delta-60 repeat protein
MESFRHDVRRHFTPVAVCLAAWLALQCGCAIAAPPPPPERASASLTQPDGRKLVGGYYLRSTTPWSGYTFAVWRLNADGTPDATFNGDGFVSIPIWGYYEGVGSLALQPDGKIVVAGTATDPIPFKAMDVGNCHPALCYYYPAIARLEADGTIDATFNGNGRIVLAIGNANADPNGVQDYGTLSSISLEADGSIVAWDAGNRIARVKPDGTLDRSFVDGGPTPREVLFADAQGIWYASPAESESGWGIGFAQQGEILFATWFTYDAGGRPWWVSAALVRTGEGVYQGRVYESRGPAFDAQPFDPAQVSRNDVGDATLTFADRDHATFAYNLKPAGRDAAVSQSRAITRQVFGPRKGCSWGTLDLDRATNYQDLWWASPAESEAGWGVNLAHQGDTVFATWFTYGRDGAPLWLSGTATKIADGRYAGTLNRTTGPMFDAIPWDESQATTTAVGTFALTFADGDRGTFGYRLALDGATAEQEKPITRQVFREPGTTCR